MFNNFSFPLSLSIVQIPGEHGYFGAGGILEWGPQFNYSKRLEMDCRGAICDLYTTCLEKPEENATVTYTYAWTSQSKANSNQYYSY